MGLALAARAKLNLYLAVRARRPDGYHEVETVLASVEVADRITMDHARGLVVDCSPPVTCAAIDNLAARAARELAEDADVLADISVFIEKRIPEAAGLGGGSADAAAVLLGANRLWDLGWPIERLRTVGSVIGVDVPFLISGGAAIGRGRGDILETVAPWSDLGVALALPKRQLSAAEVYARCRPDPGGIPVEGAAAAVSARNLSALAELMRNDLTDAATELAPEIGSALAVAAAEGVPALMSGSGPTVFGLSDDPERLVALRGRWEAEGFATLATSTAAHGVTPIERRGGRPKSG